MEIYISKKPQNPYSLGPRHPFVGTTHLLDGRMADMEVERVKRRKPSTALYYKKTGVLVSDIIEPSCVAKPISSTVFCWAVLPLALTFLLYNKKPPHGRWLLTER